MYIIDTYTFAPGDPGVGTITIPQVLELETFGVITNVTRNSVIYDPAEGQAGASISHGLGTTVLTLEQSTTYCDAADKLQIAVMPELVNGKVPVDIGTNIDVTIDNTSIEVSNDAGNPIPISDAGGSITVDGPLTNAELRASAVPVSPNIQQGGGAITPSTTRVTLATDGPGVSALSSIDNKTPALSSGRQPVEAFVPARTPTTSSVASSASSVTILAANANRRGVSIFNDSTATLRLSFSTPATTSNAFIGLPAGAFLLLDQQMIVTGAIYGIWASANGTAQVTEFV